MVVPQAQQDRHRATSKVGRPATRQWEPYFFSSISSKRLGGTNVYRQNLGKPIQCLTTKVNEGRHALMQTTWYETKRFKILYG